ncbi:unnamed protein product [Musa acuminata subsp. malaccensis]|uniref:AT-hook motif nuclear-localized protein n=1 Tax=Musa acuminata subsp. malaccensis TaxID=214687 RepID=A0A804IST6_MUSAM|nr:PREDICTED: AT-hook motif nuclear-localized protein 9-like [Musa acuminata subsp. malaccensis]CAG1843094.1 unnamed protein product [Musa acuminata subsp. malaccensis]
MGGTPRPDLVGTAPPGFPPLPKSAASSAAPSDGASSVTCSVESSLPGGGFGAIAGQEEPEEAKPRGYGCDGSEASIHERRRGRPPGSRRLGEWIVTSAGVGFTPHVMMIAVGENISEKIMSFSKQGPRAVFILSAYGAVSTVTLHKPGTSGIMVTYEGLFEILCLSGLYLPTNNDGLHSQSRGLCISLSSPYGRVIGGLVGGSLIAAKPVQVIVGSFIYAGSSAKDRIITEDGRDDVSEHQIRDKQGKPFSVPQNQDITPKMKGGLPGP